MKQGLVMVVAGTALLAPGLSRAQAIFTREVSRSAPIVAVVDGIEAQYQGTYEVVSPPQQVPIYRGSEDNSSFRFPHRRGHLRAIDTALITSSQQAFEVPAALFDAADEIPDPASNADPCASYFTASCRTIFTTVELPDTLSGLAQRPDRIFFDSSNLAAIRPFLAPTLNEEDATTLMSRVRAGILVGSVFKPALGGIDRSTLAVVEPSPFIPPIAGEDRPTMIYVGALDGMLHAICAEVRGPCTEKGQELWAFIPRTQLAALRFNDQRVDGSVKVADVFDDFDLSDGVILRGWRTVLTLQTGSGNPGSSDRQPSVLAIDISNPADPEILWERSTPSNRGTVDQGVGLGLAMGPVRMSATREIRNLTFVQTNNGGTSPSAGFYLVGIDTSTGAMAWPQPFTHIYPAPRQVGNPPVPDSGIPGGAAVFDFDQSGFVTDVAVSTLYGDLWVMKSDGIRPYGDDPIFRFSRDFQPIGAPPTIYADLADGRIHAIVVSGSYADPGPATWTTTSEVHFAVSLFVEPPAIDVPLNEGSAGDIDFVIELAPDELATAQAVVQGNELFVTTDSTDANLLSYGSTPGTGSLARYSLNGGTQKGATIVIAGGASSTAVTAEGVVHVGSGGGAMKADVNTTGGGGVFDAIGRALERGERENNARLLWLNG